MSELRGADTSWKEDNPVILAIPATRRIWARGEATHPGYQGRGEEEAPTAN